MAVIDRWSIYRNTVSNQHLILGQHQPFTKFVEAAKNLTKLVEVGKYLMNLVKFANNFTKFIEFPNVFQSS